MSPGCGVMASGHRVVGGASVTIVETQTANVASGSSSTSLSTTLLSTDVVIIIMSKGSSGTNTVSMNSSAITAYSSRQNGIGSTRLFVYQRTGLTGSHSVSYSFGAAGRVTIYVIRGLTTQAISTEVVSVWDGTTTASGVDEGTSSVSISANQVGIAYGTAAGGTITFPSNPTPSSGWTNDRVDASGVGNASVSSQVFASGGTAQMNIKSTGGPTQVACGLLIVA